MGEYAQSYLIVLGVALGVTLAATPVARWLAVKSGAVVEPAGGRHVHTRPTPTLGGAAMFAGFLAAFAVASQLEFFESTFTDSSEPLGILLAAGVMFLVGALDDLRDVSPPAKIAGMVLAGSLLAQFGVTMFFLRVPFNLGHQELIVLGSDWAALVSAVWVVVMANAINLVDGLDGLAAGIVAIAGTALFLFADRLLHFGYLEPGNVGPLVAIIAVGVCLGFLPYNFNPAKIFMGDAGALFLGLLLAIPTITVGGRSDVSFSGNVFFFYSPLLIPVVILGVPMLDTAFSFLRRVVRRRSFADADREHLHHRLVRLGHGPRRAVAILWAWTALLSAVALLPVLTNRGEIGTVQLDALVPFALAALALSLYIAFHPGARRQRRIAARVERKHPSALVAVGADAVPAGSLATGAAVATATAGGTDIVEIELPDAADDDAVEATVVPIDSRRRRRA